MNSIHDKTSRDPVDIVAVRILHSKGVKSGAIKPLAKTVYHSHVAPQLLSQREVSRRIGAWHGGKNLTGMRVGRFTVIGMVNLCQYELNTDEARWAVRCDCGIYEMRKARSIKNPNNQEDCCYDCRVLAQSKRHHERWKNS